MANSQTPAELKNCKLENPFPLFRALAQYLGSDKRRIWAPASKMWNGTKISVRHLMTSLRRF